MKAFLRDALSVWDNFWFSSKSDSNLATVGIFRLCFCTVIWFAYFARSFDLEFFYTEQGIFPSAFRKSLEFFKYRPTLLDGITNVNVLYVWDVVLLIALAMLALGLFTRVAAIVTFIVHMMFVNRNMFVLFGVDTIGTFFLLYLCFAQSAARYSLDAWLRSKKIKENMAGHIAWRLMQIQVCIVYGYSGMEKLKGSRWWDGSALWDVLSAGNIQRWDLSFVAHVPLLLASSVYVLLIFEVYFPVLIWVPRLRIPMIIFGVVLHIGIFLFMNLPSFGFMMMCMYLLFLREDEIARGVGAATRLFRTQRYS